MSNDEGNPAAGDIPSRGGAGLDNEVEPACEDKGKSKALSISSSGNVEDTSATAEIPDNMRIAAFDFATSLGTYMPLHWRSTITQVRSLHSLTFPALVRGAFIKSIEGPRTCPLRLADL